MQTTYDSAIHSLQSGEAKHIHRVAWEHGVNEFGDQQIDCNLYFVCVDAHAAEPGKVALMAYKDGGIVLDENWNPTDEDARAEDWIVREKVGR